MTIDFATPYNGKQRKVVLEQYLPSLTDQDKKDECDLNFVMAQYVKTGKPLPCVNATYADTTNPNLAKDYIDALAIVADHSSNFEQLPAKDRERFGNVTNYLEFISNPANLKESYTKGYIDRSTVAEEVIFPERFINDLTVHKDVVTDVVSPSPTVNNSTPPVANTTNGETVST